MRRSWRRKGMSRIKRMGVRGAMSHYALLGWLLGAICFGAASYDSIPTPVSAATEEAATGLSEIEGPIGTEADLFEADRQAEWGGVPTTDGSCWDLFVDGLHPRWSPDGRAFLFRSLNPSPVPYGGRKVWVIDSYWFEVKLLTHGVSNEAWPEWSPDGKYITFISDAPVPGDGGAAKKRGMNLWVMNAKTLEARPLTTCFADLVSAVWSPDGRRLLLTTLGLDDEQKSGVYVLDLESRALRGMRELPRPGGSWLTIASAFWLKGGSKIGLLVCSPFQGKDWSLTIMNSDGSGPVALAIEKPPIAAVPSPDGDKILVRCQEEPAKSDRIVIVNADGSRERVIYESETEGLPHTIPLLFFGGSYSGHMSWSPDGSKIAFAVGRRDQSDILVASSDGSWTRELVTGPEDECGPAWSPDGRRILFFSFPRSVIEEEKEPSQRTYLYLAMINSDGSEFRRFFDFGALREKEGSDLVACLRKATDPKEVEMIGSRLGAIADREASREVAGLTRDADAEIRRRAVAALGAFGRLKDIIPIGVALCNDEDEAVRMTAAEALSERENIMAVAFLTQALDSEPSPRLKEKIVRIIEKIANRQSWLNIKKLRVDQATKPLLRLLEDGDGDESLREAAIDALLKTDDPEAAYTLTRLLPERKDKRIPILEYLDRIGGVHISLVWWDVILDYLEDPDAEVRKLAISVLGKMGERAVCDRIAALLKDPDEGVRAMAAVALCELKDKRGLSAIRFALTSEDGSLRRRAVGSLAGFDEPEVLDMLIERSRDKALGIQVDAVQQICKRNDPNIFEVLVGFLDHPHDSARMAVINELPRFGLERARPVLLRNLKENSVHYVRARCAQILGLLGDREAVPALLESLQSDPRIKVDAVEALGLIGDPRALEALRPLVNDGAYLVRTGAEEAIRRIESHKGASEHE
jgi:HEAT repeat protein/Tol biopolymer transport system component